MISRFLNGLLAALCLVLISSFSAFAKTEAECLYAVDYGTKQIEKDPADFRGYACRGSAYSYLKKYDLAEKDLLKAIKLKPDEAGVYVHLAAVYRNTQRFDKAISAVRKSIALGNKQQSTYDYELACLDSANRNEDCLKRSEEIFKLFPNDGSALYYMAVSKRILGRFTRDEIVDNLTMAGKLDPADEAIPKEMEWVLKFYKPKQTRR